MLEVLLGKLAAPWAMVGNATGENVLIANEFAAFATPQFTIYFTVYIHRVLA
jgi:hypothetical protein